MVTVNHHVRGSSPRWGAIKFRHLQGFLLVPFLLRILLWFAGEGFENMSHPRLFGSLINMGAFFFCGGRPETLRSLQSAFFVEGEVEEKGK